MQIFVNLISRAFFMSTPLILGGIGRGACRTHRNDGYGC